MKCCNRSIDANIVFRRDCSFLLLLLLSAIIKWMNCPYKKETKNKTEKRTNKMTIKVNQTIDRKTTPIAHTTYNHLYAIHQHHSPSIWMRSILLLFYFFKLTIYANAFWNVENVWKQTIWICVYTFYCCFALQKKQLRNDFHFEIAHSSIACSITDWMRGNENI